VIRVTDSLRVGPSAIHGIGAFAVRSFSTAERVFVIDDSRVVDEAHPLGASEDPRHCDYLEAGKVVLMQSPERHINHSCDPNTYVKTIDGRRLVLALRGIHAGEEITYDYCINSSGDTVWHCHCAAERCRHVIHSDFFHLSLDLQREYLPLLDSWFRQERSTEIAQLEERLRQVRATERLARRSRQSTNSLS
jgi:hypothetical protein